MSALLIFGWVGLGAAGAISVAVPLAVEFLARSRKRIAPAERSFRPVLIQGGKPQAPPPAQAVPARAPPESRIA